MFKKVFITAVILTMFLMMAVVVSAESNKMAGDCANCMKLQGNLSTEPFQKFQADTIDLRQQLVNKRFDMQRENLKAMPDKTKISSLQKDIVIIQEKILYIHSQSGLPEDKSDGECLKNCDKSSNGCAKRTGGCNSTECFKR